MHCERRHIAREELLWRLHRQGHEASCDITVGRSGFEARFLMDGRFLYSHTFTQPQEAIAWAGQKQTQYRLQGWTPV